MSGRSVTFAGVRLEVNAVPVGSGPLHCGVRNCPEYELKIQLDSQPPKIAFSPLPAFAKNLFPSPNGSSKTVLAVTRWRGVSSEFPRSRRRSKAFSADSNRKPFRSSMSLAHVHEA